MAHRNTLCERDPFYGEVKMRLDGTRGSAYLTLGRQEAECPGVADRYVREYAEACGGRFETAHVERYDRLTMAVRTALESARDIEMTIGAPSGLRSAAAGLAAAADAWLAGTDWLCRHGDMGLDDESLARGAEAARREMLPALMGNVLLG